MVAQAITFQDKGFNRALWLAAMLHLILFIALGVIHIKIKSDFPFQIVNIRLGDSAQRKVSDALKSSTYALNTSPTASIPTPMPKPPVPRDKPAAKPAEEQKIHTWKRTRTKGDEFHPVARTLDNYLKKGIGLSPETDAEVTKRYTQVLSLWLYKFRDYPEAARKQGISGKALIRLRIERSGRILFYQLDRPTGSPVLDAAIRDMVFRASPVPEVPHHYPGGSQLEFLIPIAFSLD